MQRSVLVTGGAGFIGLATVKELVDHNHRVIVLDAIEEQVHGIGRPVPPELERLTRTGGVEFIRGYVEDDDLLARILPRCQAVIHLAAVVGVGQSTYEARRYTERNVLAVSTLLDQIRRNGAGIERVVAASSISNYGEGAGYNPRTRTIVTPVRPRDRLLVQRWEPIDPADGSSVESCPTTESYPLTPQSIYGLTKAFTEDAMRLLSQMTAMPVVCLRYGNVYGGGQALSNPYTGALCTFYARLQSGNEPLLFEDGQQRRRYTHVSDVARANRFAIEKPLEAYTCVNISSEQDLSLDRVCHLLAQAIGVEREPRILGVARVGDVRHIRPDASRAATQIGFKAETSFSDGLNEFLTSARLQTVVDNTPTALHQLRKHLLLVGRLPEDIDRLVDDAKY